MLLSDRVIRYFPSVAIRDRGTGELISPQIEDKVPSYIHMLCVCVCVSVCVCVCVGMCVCVSVCGLCVCV